jgi:hypothetical protein
MRSMYGPLDGAITLDGIHTRQQLDALLAPDPTRLHHATSLSLTTRDPSLYEPAPTTLLDPEFLAALPAAFPKLRSLTFSAASKVLEPELSILAPRSSFLTAITLPALAGGRLHAAAISIQPFTNLIALAVDLGVVKVVNDLRQALAELACLPSLRDLAMWGEHLDHDGLAAEHACLGCAAHWFSRLGSLTLTRLAVHMPLHRWDHAAAQALATALPQLKALVISPDFQHASGDQQPADASARQPVLDALASRTGLTALQLNLGGLGAGASLRGCSKLLQLHELHVVASNGTEDAGHDPADPEGQLLQELLEAMAVHRTLTRLAVARAQWISVPVGVSGQGLHHLLSLSGSLEVLELAARLPCSFVSSLVAMTRLSRLKFTNVSFDGVDFREWQRAANEHWPSLSRLSNLQVLEVMDDRYELGKAFLLHASALTHLRELALGVNYDDGAGHEMVCDADVWRISGLHRTLTRLTFEKIDGMEVTGPGLAVVSRLTCLQHLAVNQLQRSTYERLHEYLLPLPPSLRRLHAEHWAADAGWEVELHESLVAAAWRQDCAVRVGDWL